MQVTVPFADLKGPIIREFELKQPRCGTVRVVTMSLLVRATESATRGSLVSETLGGCAVPTDQTSQPTEHSR